MFNVKCPECLSIRQIKAKKKWMKGEQPYSNICKSCCQIGKEYSEQTKEKLSISVKNAQTEELLQKKSEFAKTHPDIWKTNLVYGAGGGWNKGCKISPHTEETKQKISESMKKTLKKKKEDKNGN